MPTKKDPKDDNRNPVQEETQPSAASSSTTNFLSIFPKTTGTSEERSSMQAYIAQSVAQGPAIPVASPETQALVDITNLNFEDVGLTPDVVDLTVTTQLEHIEIEINKGVDTPLPPVESEPELTSVKDSESTNPPPDAPMEKTESSTSSHAEKSPSGQPGTPASTGGFTFNTPPKAESSSKSGTESPVTKLDWAEENPLPDPVQSTSTPLPSATVPVSEKKEGKAPAEPKSPLLSDYARFETAIRNRIRRNERITDDILSAEYKLYYKSQGGFSSVPVQGVLTKDQAWKMVRDCKRKLEEASRIQEAKLQPTVTLVDQPVVDRLETIMNLNRITDKNMKKALKDMFNLLSKEFSSHLSAQDVKLKLANEKAEEAQHRAQILEAEIRSIRNLINRAQTGIIQNPGEQLFHEIIGARPEDPSSSTSVSPPVPTPLPPPPAKTEAGKAVMRSRTLDLSIFKKK